MASAGSAKSQRARRDRWRGNTDQRVGECEVLSLDSSHLVGNFDLHAIAARRPLAGQGHIARDTDRLQLQDTDQEEGAIGDHPLRDGEAFVTGNPPAATSAW